MGGGAMNNGNCKHCGRCGHTGCVHKVPIFSVLDLAEQESIYGLIEQKSYLKGQFILMEGGNPEGLMIVNTGRVKVLHYTPEGREQILYVLSEGDFFGERYLYRSGISAYYVEALENTELCVIRSREFMKFLGDHPKIAIKMIEELGRRMERLEDALQNIGVKSVESRVTSALVDFASRYGKPENNGILLELPLSREGIANYIGTARETVSRKLGLLQVEGLIVIVGNKKLFIPDLKKLENAR